MSNLGFIKKKPSSLERFFPDKTPKLEEWNESFLAGKNHSRKEGQILEKAVSIILVINVFVNLPSNGEEYQIEIRNCKI